MDAQTKKRQTVISPEQTEETIVVPPEVPHDTRICIEDLVDMEIDQLREKREVQGESVDNRHAKLVHRNRWNAQTRSSAATWLKEASMSETHVGSCSVSNEECSGTSRWPVTRPLMEETMRSTLSSPKQAVKAMTTAIERAGENRETENAVFQVEVREQKDAQIQHIDRVVDIPEWAEDGDSYCHARFLCVPEACDELRSMD